MGCLGLTVHTLSSALDDFRGRRVLVTGHTGFKGSWLSTWLSKAGADVWGYALPPSTEPNLFTALGLERKLGHREGDVRDRERLRKVWEEARPEIVFHLAAQPVVKESYRNPLETLETNVLGLSHVLELSRLQTSQLAVVVVTSDKCYENRETFYGYRETDTLGGVDPYSASKACCELVVSSYRRSFFEAEGGLVSVASARAGNVIGGGDWALDRIMPDCFRALSRSEPVHVRNPHAVRPWQHVLEPLSGYLMLGSRLLSPDAEERRRFCEAWNFGPSSGLAASVRDVVESTVEHWGSGSWKLDPTADGQHESSLLVLSIDKALSRLDWTPRWGIAKTIEETVRWYRAFYASEDVRRLTEEQIEVYQECRAR